MFDGRKVLNEKIERGGWRCIRCPMSVDRESSHNSMQGTHVCSSLKTLAVFRNAEFYPVLSPKSTFFPPHLRFNNPYDLPPTPCMR